MNSPVSSNRRSALPLPGERRSSAAEARRAGFTLVEIIVVLGIIILLLILVVPALWSVKESARTTGCLSNLRQIGAGLNAYLADHELTMPTLVGARAASGEPGAAIDNTLDKYVKNKTVFICPADPKIGKASGTSYFWNTVLNGQKLGSLEFMKMTDQSHIAVIFDKEGFHPFAENKVNILYADGHAAKELSYSTER